MLYIIFHLYREAYPDLVLTDVQFAYDVSKLNKLEKDRRSMHIGKITSEKILEQTNQRPQMFPFHFGSLVELCCCCFTRCGNEENSRRTDSIAYYTENETELLTQIGELKEFTLKKPLGILFVTFQNQKMTDAFLKHYRLGPVGNFLNVACVLNSARCASCYLCKDLARNSSISHDLRSNSWHAKYAPSPSNIKWENVSKIGAMWWFRCILINLILIILMIFFTTPAILIDKLTPWSELLNINTIEV
jgi:hypothetical protein